MWIFDKIKELYIRCSRKRGGVILYTDEPFVISSLPRVSYFGSSFLNVEITATHEDTQKSLFEALNSRKPIKVFFDNTINFSIIINSIRETLGPCGYRITVEGGTASEEFIYG